jgi:hypothetical protein
MSVERYGNFITLSAGNDTLQLPFVAYESGKQTVATMVDQARTADGIVRGAVIAKASKLELTWKVLSPAVWAQICTFFNNHFYFDATYLDMETNSFVTKKFYVGDRSAMPFIVDEDTGIPTYYLDCQANIIGVGETL